MLVPGTPGHTIQSNGKKLPATVVNDYGNGSVRVKERVWGTSFIDPKRPNDAFRVRDYPIHVGPGVPQPGYFASETPIPEGTVVAFPGPAAVAVELKAIGTKLDGSISEINAKLEVLLSRIVGVEEMGQEIGRITDKAVAANFKVLEQLRSEVAVVQQASRGAQAAIEQLATDLGSTAPSPMLSLTDGKPASEAIVEMEVEKPQPNGAAHSEPQTDA